MRTSTAAASATLRPTVIPPVACQESSGGMPGGPEAGWMGKASWAPALVGPRYGKAPRAAASMRRMLAAPLLRSVRFSGRRVAGAFNDLV